MPRKVIIVADPGIDTAFAVALALNDPNLEVVGLLPTAGNVPADQATANVHTLIDVIEPRITILGVSGGTPMQRP